MTEQETQIQAVNDELTDLEDQFIDLTKRRIFLLERKIEALDRLLHERNKAIEEVEALRGLLDMKRTSKHSASDRAASAANVVSGEFDKMYVWQAVEIVLRRERRELTTRQIVDRLLAGGKKLNAKNPSSQVHTSIADKKDRFYKDADKHVWGLVDWQNSGDEKEQRLTPGLRV